MDSHEYFYLCKTFLRGLTCFNHACYNQRNFQNKSCEIYR